MIGGANPVLGGFDAERFAVVEEGLHKFFGVLADIFSGGSGVGDDAVVHVGQVHDVLQLESSQLEEAPENVLEDKRAVVADVRIVVDRRAAGVHAYFARFLRDEGFGLSGQSIVQLDFGHRRSVLFLVN